MKTNAMPARRYLCNALVTIALASGCASSPTAPADEVPLAFTRLRAEPFSFVAQSGMTQRGRFVVKTQEQWLATWAAIHPGSPLSLPPPLPVIDFEREMLIVAAMGAQSTGGYTILIEGASEGPRGVTVQVRSISPGAGCVVTLAVTQPVDIARLPRRDGTVAFAEKLETRSCPP